MAAHYISLSFPLETQAKFFTHYSDNNTMVVRFLAGLSSEALRKALIDTHSFSSLKFRMEDIHRLFEAKLHPPQQDVIGDCIEPVENPFSSYVLGYLIANSACHWDVYISNKIETIRMFIHGAYGASDRHFGSKLTLHVKIEDYVHSNLAELYRAPFAIEKLELRPYFEETISSQGNKYGIDSTRTLSNNSTPGIQHLCLSKLKFNTGEANKLKSYLSNTKSITSLSLVYCKINVDGLVYAMEGVQACSSLQRLNLYFSPYYEIHSNPVFKMLEANRTLIELHVTCELYVVCMLANTMCTNCTIKTLSIEGDSLDYELERNDVSIAVAKMFKENKTIKDFNLFNIDLCTEDICNIAEALCDNSAVERLDLSHSCIEVRGSELLAKMLQENTTLKQLNLSSCCIVRNGISIIAESLRGNRFLEVLIFSVDDIGVSGAEAFASVLENNAALKELYISDMFSFLHKTVTEWAREFMILSNALCRNTTLVKLRIIPPSLFRAEEIIRQVMITENVKDNRIYTLP